MPVEEDPIQKPSAVDGVVAVLATGVAKPVAAIPGRVVDMGVTVGVAELPPPPQAASATTNNDAVATLKAMDCIDFPDE